MIRKFLNKIGLLDTYYRRRLSKRIMNERMREEQLVISHLSPDKFSPLTKEEMQLIDNQWGGVVGLPIKSYKEFEMYKHLRDFDPRFLTHFNYLPVIARLLNDYQYTRIFDNKGLLGYLRPTGMKFPECYIRHIASDYYDSKMRQISLNDAIDLLSEHEEIFIKPSRDTSGGKGAKRLCMKNLTINERKAITRHELTERTNEFVVQKCIHQHLVMAQFNSSSVNTFRITTLWLNGKFSVCSIALRCGKDGSHVDNWGAGGLLVHVMPNGDVTPIAYDRYLNEHTHNGNCIFAECKIPQMPEILKSVEKSHREDFPICKFIGWDITIDEDGTPIIVELNSSQPGLTGEQTVCGPIFGDRTQEVIDYCKSKQFTY